MFDLIKSYLLKAFAKDLAFLLILALILVGIGFFAVQPANPSLQAAPKAVCGCTCPTCQCVPGSNCGCLH